MAEEGGLVGDPPLNAADETTTIGGVGRRTATGDDAPAIRLRCNGGDDDGDTVGEGAAEDAGDMPRERVGEKNAGAGAEGECARLPEDNTACRLARGDPATSDGRARDTGGEASGDIMGDRRRGGESLHSADTAREKLVRPPAWPTACTLVDGAAVAAAVAAAATIKARACSECASMVLEAPTPGLSRLPATGRLARRKRCSDLDLNDCAAAPCAAAPSAASAAGVGWPTAVPGMDSGETKRRLLAKSRPSRSLDTRPRRRRARLVLGDSTNEPLALRLTRLKLRNKLRAFVEESGPLGELPATAAPAAAGDRV